VARVCLAIAADRENAYNLTIKRNTVAIVTDGTAVLGLGNIGPEAAMPVMEGKAALFKEFAGVDAFPICLNTTDPEEIVACVKAMAPGFGGINLEDISAPHCFEIEERLRRELDIPVYHDDQHGTAVVVLAALINALKIVDKDLPDIKVVVNGVGAAGTACTRILLAAGVRTIVGCDQYGVLDVSRADLDVAKRWYAEHTNPEGVCGNLRDALRGADVFLGLSTSNVLHADDLDLMARDPIVFALANPVPEIMPEEAAGHVRVMATGRSDYPNQINNVLCFPGMFRGALDARAVDITEHMNLAAAQAIAGVIPDDTLMEEYMIPSVFDERVVPAVAAAVMQAAIEDGVARRAVEPGVEPHGMSRGVWSS
jgi:malate dehydrogenase (oxaloacetate-decarboxylating)